MGCGIADFGLHNNSNNSNQVDRARRMEVAVKVKESKDNTFRDEVRSLSMVEFTRFL